MYLLDTDYMSLMQRGTMEGQELFRRLMSSNITPATTIVTYEEQMRGWLDRRNLRLKFVRISCSISTRRITKELQFSHLMRQQFRNIISSVKSIQGLGRWI